MNVIHINNPKAYGNIEDFEFVHSLAEILKNLDVFNSIHFPANGGGKVEAEATIECVYIDRIPTAYVRFINNQEEVRMTYAAFIKPLTYQAYGKPITVKDGEFILLLKCDVKHNPKVMRAIESRHQSLASVVKDVTRSLSLGSTHRKVVPLKNAVIASV